MERGCQELQSTGQVLILLVGQPALANITTALARANYHIDPMQLVATSEFIPQNLFPPNASEECARFFFSLCQIEKKFPSFSASINFVTRHASIEKVHWKGFMETRWVSPVRPFPLHM